VILAVNATVEGQTTAHYLMDTLAVSGVKVTRLAHGVPVGGELALVEPVAEPLRGGGADFTADGERAPAMARAVEIGAGNQRRCHIRGEI